MPKFSICIPAYNRSRFLRPLLDSIVIQDFQDYNVVITEDCSPERDEIKKIVMEYQNKYGDDRICYFENSKNLGFDGNLRRLIQLADGEYCFFMGNDDLLSPGALGGVEQMLRKHENVGIVLRSYGWFNEQGIEHVVRYCSSDRFFNAGEQAIVFAYRRVGVISGYIVHRQAAHQIATNKYDGTLYYQMYLTFNILKHMNAIYINDTIVLCRNDVPPDFGNSESEKGKYKPGNYTVNARVLMISSILKIAKEESERNNIDVFPKIVSDIAKYSYPILARERTRGVLTFITFYYRIGRLGLAKNAYYHIYFLLLLFIGKKNVDWLFYSIKNKLGYTPNL